ncbi:MAG: hypothetical protein MUF78_10025, partial [Candidatus Edwardsbacteria bacterium]|nr:hypothetical protein [Candidatus Edwardsbacteria bacterium]
WPLRDSLGQPIVVSVQDGYAAYSDVNPAFTFTGETPVGVRIDQVSYAWNVAQLNDLVFFRTTVKNVTADTLRNVYIGPPIPSRAGPRSASSAADISRVPATIRGTRSMWSMTSTRAAFRRTRNWA